MLRAETSGVLIASGDVERLAEYAFSSSEGEVAAKWVDRAASKDARMVGTEAMRASTWEVVDFLIAFYFVERL